MFMDKPFIPTLELETAGNAVNNILGQPVEKIEFTEILPRLNDIADSNKVFNFWIYVVKLCTFLCTYYTKSYFKQLEIILSVSYKARNYVTLQYCTQLQGKYIFYSKTAYRGFKSFCPCQQKTIKKILSRKTPILSGFSPFQAAKFQESKSQI